MTEQTLPLITFYKGWETYQQSLVETIAPLSSEQLALPVASHHWSIGMVAQHMVAARVWWFQVWMGEGSPDLAPIAHWDPADKEERPALESAELVAGLEATWHMIADALARWTPADLGHIFPTGCATRWNSSAIWLQSILPDSPASIRQRYFCSLPIKSVGIERASEAHLAESTSRCASRGYFTTLKARAEVISSAESPRAAAAACVRLASSTPKTEASPARFP